MKKTLIGIGKWMLYAIASMAIYLLIFRPDKEE